MARDDDELRSVEERLGDGEGMDRVSDGLWEASPDLCLLLGSEQRILRVNRMGAAALGYAPEDLVGRSWTDFVHPDDRQRSMDESARARRGRARHVRLENRWKASDGCDRWLLWTASVVAGGYSAYAVGRDITELKEAQGALRAIEARHRTALTGLEEGVVLQDAQSRILLANPAARRILGLGDVVVGAVSEDPGWETLREDGSVLSPQDQPVAMVMRTGKPQIGVVLGLRWHGGDVRWLRVSARAVEPFEGGGPAPVVSSFVDVTQLKAVQDDLRGSEARFRSLADSTPVGILLTDRAGEVVYFNPAIEAVARRFGDVAPGGWIETAVHRDDRERVARGWAEAVAERRPYAEDYRLGLPDGQIRWVQLRAAPVDGAHEGFVASVVDITERVEAEAEARSQEARLRAVVDNVHAAIYVKDVDGRYELVNRRAAEVSGRAVEEMVGRTDGEFFPRDVAEAFRASDREVLRSGRPLEVEERVVWPDGQERVSLTAKVPLLDAEGEPAAICGISTDITDRVRAESEREELRARVARVERLDTVARLASGIAHDFNNLLSVIQNAASVAANRAVEGRPAREEIDEIRAAATRAAELIRRLMLFARREGPELAAIDLRGPLAEIARTLPGVLGDRFDVRLQTADDLWPALGDRALVEQSLLNLAANARDAMPEGGSVRISADNVDLAEQTHAALPAGRYVRLAVSDTGHGMGPEVASRALEPFFTTKTKGQGAGLGLATVWGTATMAGGTVEIVSSPDEGTTIAMFLASEQEDAPSR